MIEVVYYKIKKEEKASISFKELVEKKSREILTSGDIDEVEKKIKENEEGYTFLFVSEEEDKNELMEKLGIQYYSNIDGFFIGRAENVFVFVVKDKKVKEYLHKCIVNSIECEINMDKNNLKKWIEDYKEILENIEKEVEEKKWINILKMPKNEIIEKLIAKNRALIPFITENGERVKRLKKLAEKEKLNGVFHSILMDIPEEEMETLKVWIDISLQYEDLLMQHYMERREYILQILIFILTVILGVDAFLSIFLNI